MSPILLDRINRLDGCQGYWILDLRDSDNRGYDLHYLSSGYLATGFGTIKTPEDALAYCCANRWRDCRLLFCSDYLNDDCRWPGCYSAPSIYRSNARVFRENHASALDLADGDADGISLDIRYITPEMLDDIDSLESYPLLSDDDHSSLELELQDEAWESWAANDWRRLVERKLQDALPVDSDDDADTILDSVPDVDSKLAALFHACAEQTNTYWQEESGDQWIDLERVVSALDLADLRELTGLPLISPDNLWRREPYPWQGAEPSPLIN